MTNRTGLLGFLLSAGLAWSQPPAQEEPPKQILIHPQKESVPALKYALLPSARELKPGNAAIYYHRAMLLRCMMHLKPAEENQIADWLDMPLERLPREEVRTTLKRYRTVLHELELGARRVSVDWGLEFRTEGIALLLPDVQAMRAMIQLVALQIKLDTVEKHFDQAVHALQTGLSMSRHVGQRSITLVQTLVGIAMTTVIAQRVEEFLQTPDAPNLYWPLSQLPEPFVSVRPGMEAEHEFAYLQFPELRRITTQPMTLEDIEQVVDGLLRTFGDMTGGAVRDPEIQRIAITAVTLKFYVPARRWLRSQGLSDAQIGAMPTLQVVMLYSLSQYKRLEDDMYKWVYLPYWQAAPGLDKAVQELKEAKANLTEGLPIATLLLPAMERIVFASARADRQLAALRIVEAVRLYAADHAGQLPESLDDIGEAPIPIDPVTGKPFQYKRRGDTALLVGPVPPGRERGPAATLKYELKLAR